MNSRSRRSHCNAKLRPEVLQRERTRFVSERLGKLAGVHRRHVRFLQCTAMQRIHHARRADTAPEGDAPGSRPADRARLRTTPNRAGDVLLRRLAASLRGVARAADVQKPESLPGNDRVFPYAKSTRHEGAKSRPFASLRAAGTAFAEKDGVMRGEEDAATLHAIGRSSCCPITQCERTASTCRPVHARPLQRVPNYLSAVWANAARMAWEAKVGS